MTDLSNLLHDVIPVTEQLAILIFLVIIEKALQNYTPKRQRLEVKRSS